MTQTPLTILLIEDNPADARLLQIALVEVGARSTKLIHVERLTDARQRLQTEAVNVILLDLTLPDGQGAHAVRTLQEYAPHTPIIVLTGRSDEETITQVLAAGAQGFLVKGELDGEEILRTLHTAIE